MIPANHERIFSIISSAVERAREKSKKESKCYLVGGYTRDYLIGKEPKDIDIVCNDLDAIINEIETILKEKNINYKRTAYATFGTVLLHFLGEDVEFVIPRKESYRQRGSRNPTVEEGTFEDDATRRDFTLNSIYLSLDRENYLKPVDLTRRGLSDLKQGILDTPLDPDVTFDQDPLRMMRLARFIAVKGFKPATRVIESARKNAERIKIIVPERIQEEIKRSLHSKSYFRVLDDIGLLDVIFPELKPLKGLAQPARRHKYDVFEHTLRVVECVPVELKLAALYHDTGKVISEITGNFIDHEIRSEELARYRFSNLKFPKDEIDFISRIVRDHMVVTLISDEKNLTDAAIRRFIKKHCNDIKYLFQFSKCDKIATGVNVEHDIESIESLEDRIRDMQTSCPVPQKIAISGNEIMEILGITSGAMVGKIKGELMAKVVDNEIENDKKTLSEYVKIHYKR